jgi:tetratricopeptide (TPR) repeat protein
MELFKQKNIIFCILLSLIFLLWFILPGCGHSGNSGLKDGVSSSPKAAGDGNPVSAPPSAKKGTEYNPDPSSMNKLPPFKEKFASKHEESDYYVRYGLDALNRKNFSEAETKLKKAAEIEPENFDAFDGLSMLYYETHRFDNSIESSNKAIEIARKTERYETLCPTTVMVRRGACLLNKKKFDEAIKDFDEVIKYAPEFAFVYYDRGRAYFGKKEFSRAKADFLKSIELDKENRFAEISKDYLTQIEKKVGIKK